MELKEKLTERFLRYVSVSSESIEDSTDLPTSEGQKTLALMLADEMREIGMKDVYVSEDYVVTAMLPSNAGDDLPSVGWIAHLDTCGIGMSPDVHPLIVRNYDGNDICQNGEKDLWLRTAEHPELLKYRGDDVIVTDGTSVLGADDKSAVANVMTALETLCKDSSIRHGNIYAAFVPDEEIGLRGARALDLGRFRVDFAYTIDCCELGEAVNETFNAGSAEVTIEGINAHPMSAKNVLVNASLIAVDLINMLDRAETPECTEGREGFIWVKDIVSDTVSAKVGMIIRDHDLGKYEEKKRRIVSACEYLRLRNPKAKINWKLSDTYGNISDSINEENSLCFKYLYRAMDELGIEKKIMPMRGGTDGSYISTKGIPVPNYFTGAHNFHSTAEFLPLSSFEKSCLLTIKLMTLPASFSELS